MFTTWDPTTSEHHGSDVPDGSARRGLRGVAFALIALLGTVAFVATGAGSWSGWITAAAAVLWVGAITALGDVIERGLPSRRG